MSSWDYMLDDPSPRERDWDACERTCPTCHGKGAGVDIERGVRVQWVCVDCDGAGVVWDADDEDAEELAEAAE